MPHVKKNISRKKKDMPQEEREMSHVKKNISLEK